MNRIATSLILLALFALASSQIPESINCKRHNPNCDGRGICMAEGICRCYFGFKSQNLTSESCPFSLKDDKVAYDTLILNAAVYCSLFFVLTGLCAWRFYLEIRTVSERSVAMRNITKWVVGLLTFQSFSAILYYLDQGGVFDIFGPFSYVLIGRLRDWVYLMIFSSILLHWIELYQKSLKSIRKIAMMQKVNSRFQGNVTIEDILLQVSFLKKFRIPYFFFSLISLGFSATSIYAEYRINTSLTYWGIYTLYFFYLMLLWIGFLIGFLWFGFRLGKIMPPGLEGKVKALTWSVASIVIILSVYYVLYAAVRNVVVASKMSHRQTSGVLHIFSFLDFMASLAALNIYMPLRKWKKWFSTSFLRSSQSSQSKSKDESKQSDGTVDIELRKATLRGEDQQQQVEIEIKENSTETTEKVEENPMDAQSS
eukprot:TRINITY_DN481_c0_g1_i1.p1 TRINITY_DN481_c0_g1~~TRINITY_DN481_c0_g1_i1.p1  ORF type:complete len:426 (-),score=102.38 TRINITY_DN481_c0_g1_i1:214-1491(-)